MLDIQLDSRAVFLSRWRDSDSADADSGRSSRDDQTAQTFRDLVERSWDGHASPQSVGYRFTRMFREQVSEAVLTFVLSECYEADANFDHTVLRRREGPLWKLLTERPMHLLDPQFDSWDELLVQAVDDVIARAKEDGALADRVVVRVQRHGVSPSARVIGAVVRPIAEHASDAGAGRSLHRADALGHGDGVRAFRRLARARSGRASCTCRRARVATRSRRSTRTHTTRGSRVPGRR